MGRGLEPPVEAVTRGVASRGHNADRPAATAGPRRRDATGGRNPTPIAAHAVAGRRRPPLRRRIARHPWTRPLVLRLRAGRAALPRRIALTRALALSSPLAYSVASRTGRRILLCVGDSHCGVFDTVRHRRLLRRTVLNVLPIDGATAHGMANPHSKTKALVTFERLLARAPADAPVLICLGEVDCGYLLWHRSQTAGSDVRHEAAASVETYRALVARWRDDGRRVLVTSVPLPTIDDLARWKGLQGARGSIRADIRQRTELTRWYTAQLRTWAAAHGCEMVDYEDDITDPATGLVAPQFVHPNPYDHHLNHDRLAPLLADKLRGLGFH